MNEKPFFSEDGIRISKSEVVINNENVPVESLCSLSYKVVEPNKAVAGLFVVIGALLLLDGAILVIIGGFIVLLGGIAWNTAKAKYALTINTTFGDNKTLVSEDSHHIEQIIMALNKVMVSNSSRYRN